MEERYLRMMPELSPLGIIYTCNPSRCYMDMIEDLAGKIPIVVVNNQNEQMSVDAVELDNSKLGRLMRAIFWSSVTGMWRISRRRSRSGRSSVPSGWKAF